MSGGRAARGGAGVRERLVDQAYAAGWWTVRGLPTPLTAGLFRGGADLAYRRRHSSKGLTRLAVNLRRVVGPQMPDGEFDDLVRRAVRSYSRYWMELFKLPSLSRERVLATFHLAEEQMLAADLASGRGAVLALPHSGNWDLAGAWVAAHDWKLVSVAERLRPESLFDRFVAVREQIGIEIIPLTGGAQAPMEALTDKVRAGYAAALLADRDLSARAVEVAFFGGRTRMPGGPALLAIRTGAPLYAVEVWYAGGECLACLHPVPLPDPDEGSLAERVAVVTQRIADRFAEAIARHPHDWHMLQRMWLDERAPRVPAAQP